jgi:hypothetical protein
MGRESKAAGPRHKKSKLKPTGGNELVGAKKVSVKVSGLVKRHVPDDAVEQLTIKEEKLTRATWTPIAVRLLCQTRFSTVEKSTLLMLCRLESLLTDQFRSKNKHTIKNAWTKLSHEIHTQTNMVFTSKQVAYSTISQLIEVS